MSKVDTPQRASLQLDRNGLAPIVADGSMVTELLRRGYAEQPSDRYNLTIPAVIEEIHHEFINAGATLLQSNTLHANRYALESWFYAASSDAGNFVLPLF